jgi:hypothetical protein
MTLTLRNGSTGSLGGTADGSKSKSSSSSSPPSQEDEETAGRYRALRSERDGRAAGVFRRGGESGMSRRGEAGGARRAGREPSGRTLRGYGRRRRTGAEKAHTDARSRLQLAAARREPDRRLSLARVCAKRKLTRNSLARSLARGQEEMLQVAKRLREKVLIDDSGAKSRRGNNRGRRGETRRDENPETCRGRAPS